MRGVLAHLVERNTGSVEVSGSSPLYSTTKKRDPHQAAFFCHICAVSINAR